MKIYRILTFLSIIALFSLSSCFDDREIIFKGAQVEFERAVLTAKASGQNFPALTPSLTRTSGSPAYQVNLNSAQLGASETISFSIEQVPASYLTATRIQAVEGVHYTLTSSSMDFPASASKADFTGLTIIPTFPAQTGITAVLILKLDGNSKLAPSENYRRLGIIINLN